MVWNIHPPAPSIHPSHGHSEDAPLRQHSDPSTCAPFPPPAASHPNLTSDPEQRPCRVNDGRKKGREKEEMTLKPEARIGRSRNARDVRLKHVRVHVAALRSGRRLSHCIQFVHPSVCRQLSSWMDRQIQAIIVTVSLLSPPLLTTRQSPLAETRTRPNKNVPDGEEASIHPAIQTTGVNTGRLLVCRNSSLERIPHRYLE